METPFRIRPGGQRGQSAVEWTGLVLLVALLAAGLASAVTTVPGLSLAHSISTRCSAPSRWTIPVTIPPVSELLTATKCRQWSGPSRRSFLRPRHARPAGGLPDLPLTLVRGRTGGGRSDQLDGGRAGDAVHPGARLP